MPTITLAEGKYDHALALLRQVTRAKHAVTIVLDGIRGSGFAIHIGGTTRDARIQATRQMVAGLGQVGLTLLNGIAALQRLPPNYNVMIGAEPFEHQPSQHCPHCGATLPPPESPEPPREAA